MTAYQLAFLGLLVAGALLFLISIFFGEISDAIGDAIGDSGGEQDGPSWFSTSVIGTFLVTYGAIGLLATAYTDNGVVALGIGLVLAVVCAYLIRNYVLAALLRNQWDSQISNNSYVGLTARVITTIPAGGIGEIRLSDINGTSTTLAARSEQSYEPVQTGLSVVVTEMAGGTAIVSTNTTPTT